MAKLSSNSLIGMVVAFILISILFPIGLNAIANMTLSPSLDPTIGTLLTTFLPIIAVIGLVMAFLPRLKNQE